MAIDNPIHPFYNDYAEMYQHENTNATVIQAQNAWHLLKEFSQGNVGSHWEFGAGKQLSITAYADNGDSKTRVTSAAHGMSNGHVVSIAGTTNYDGIYVIEQIAENTFVIDIAYVADDGASTGEQGSYLKCIGTESGGYYYCDFSITITPAQNNDVLEGTIYKNATHSNNIEIQRKTATAADYGVASCGGILSIATGDIVTLSIRNITAAQNFTMRNANVNVVRIS